ncbi:MAG: hypothetical protein ACRCZS_02310 [Chroococcidiopsis sp.]
MAVVTFSGTTTTNQYLSPLTSHIELGHPSLVNKLILAECDDKPYENYRIGQTIADGRSLKGTIRLKGNNYKKEQWQCNFMAIAPQVALFEELLQAQQDDILPVNLIDRWVDGVVVTKNVWIDIDRQYLSLIDANSWWRLQFALLEV